MTTSLFRILTVALTAVAIGCSGEDTIRRFTPADADIRARHYLNMLAQGGLDSAKARVHPAFAEESDADIAGVSEVLSGNLFDSAHVIGAHINIFNGVRHVNLTYEQHAASGWLAANVATVDSAGSWYVEGLNAARLERSLEEQNQFALANRSLRHYLWLLIAVVCSITSLATAAFIATRRNMPRRWVWILVALLGFGSFALNWTTGEVYIRPINVQLGSGGLTQAGSAAPWILVFALPLGALLAFWRYRRFKRLEISKVDEVAPTAPVV